MARTPGWVLTALMGALIFGGTTLRATAAPPV